MSIPIVPDPKRVNYFDHRYFIGDTFDCSPDSFMFFGPYQTEPNAAITAEDAVLKGMSPQGRNQAQLTAQEIAEGRYTPLYSTYGDKKRAR